MRASSGARSCARKLRAVKHSPRLPEVLDEQPLTAEDLEDGARVRERRLRDPQLAGAELHGVDFVGVHLDGGDLSGVRLDHGGLQDAPVAGTNPANPRAAPSRVMRVQLRGCGMPGLQWAESLWRDVEVSDCRADLV